ncbi:CHRD domain-containing protein [Aquabacterium sp.]|uniref:CHRD domain-containing protein n=1 Tax=Aquabacterium sp. TaxID=1872578 RepID=UPI003D6D65AE
MHPCLTGAFCALLFVSLGAQARMASFTAVLNGAQVIGGGDPTATGQAWITIDHDLNHLEYEISFTGLGNGFDTLVAEHIHEGVAGTTGRALFSLNVSGLSGHGRFKGGFTGFPATLRITEATASQYYIDLHSEMFPNGAIRGQLTAVPEPGSLALLLAGVVGIAGWRRWPAARQLR